MQIPVTNIAGVLTPSVNSHGLLRAAYTSGAANATYVYREDLANADSNIANAGLGIEPITTTPVNVTREFFGICTGQSVGVTNEVYPVDPIDNINFGLVRSHDTRNITWKDINTAPGVYWWDQIDLWASTHKALGRKLLYTVYQTPTWASSNPTGIGPYSTLGWNQAPADWSTLSTFITALTQRMKDRGTPIDYYHICNEPNYVSGNPGKRFYAGGAASLAVMSRIVAQAAKPITPAVKIVAPGMTNWDNANVFGEGTSVSAPPLTADRAENYFAAMFAASDGAGGGMANWVDALSFHNYGASGTLYNRIKQVKQAAALAGVGSLPIIDTETGFTNSTDFLMFSNIARLFTVEAASGILGCCYYAVGNTESTNYSLRTFPKAQEWLAKLIIELTAHGVSSASFLSESATQGRVAVNINGSVRVY